MMAGPGALKTVVMTGRSWGQHRREPREKDHGWTRGRASGSSERQLLGAVDGQQLEPQAVGRDWFRWTLTAGTLEPAGAEAREGWDC